VTSWRNTSVAVADSLAAPRVEALREAAFPVRQGDGQHRHAQVGGGAQWVARAHAEAAAISIEK